MGKVFHTCTGCVPIDRAVIDVYSQITETDKLINREEFARDEAEEQRQVNELGPNKDGRGGRVKAEEERVAAESGRVSAENKRVGAESIRVANESVRVSNENTRVSREGTRVSNEQGRVSAENSRVIAEQGRVAAESGRDARYVAAEGSESGSTAGDGSRWGSYKTAEAERYTASSTAEGSSSSQAGDGTRWGNYKTAEAARDAARVAAEGTSSSVAGDGSRWGAYKGAEAARGATAAAIEGTSSSTAGDGSRWGAYKTAEVSRNTAAGAAEGSASSTAGDGSRWGSYKTAEAARNTARENAEGSSSSTAGDGSRWGSYKTAEASRDDARVAAEGTSSSTAGDGTRWGTYKTAEASRNTARETAEGSSSSTAGDGTRWGAYKAAEAARETAYETQEGSEQASVAGDGTRWGAYKTAEEGRQAELAHKANVDGYYPQMGVGTAQRLEGDEIVEGSFFERTTGADAEVANGLAQLLEAKGKSQQWNQLISAMTGTNAVNLGLTAIIDAQGRLSISGTPQSTPSYNQLGITSQVSFYDGHKYMVFGNKNPGVKWGVTGYSINKTDRAFFFNTIAGTNWNGYIALYAESGVAINVTDFIVNVLDLTLLGIDSFTTVAQVEAWLAQNIGLAPYYPYNAGTVLNNCMKGIETPGFNLLDPATGKARIIGAYSEVYGNYYGITGTHGTLTFTDDLGNESTITPDSDGKFLLEVPGELSVATPGADCAVFLWWDGTKTDYVAYEKNTARLDVKNIWGKLNGTGELVQVWPTGMPGIGDVKDSLKIEDGEVVAERKVGEVDMGTLDWYKQDSGTHPYFYALVGNNKGNNAKAISGRYKTVNWETFVTGINMALNTFFAVGSKYVNIRNESYTDASTLRTSLSGQMLYYEYVTPQTYTDLVYKNSPYFADGTPVTLPVNYTVNNWSIERIIPQNGSEAVVTTPPELKCKYAVDVVEDNKTIHDELDNLDERKADKNGDYPLMSVGSAKNLSADNSIHSELTFDKVPTGAATGLAQLQKLLGKSLVWNQLFNGTLNGNATNITALGQNRFSATLIGGTSYYQQAFYFNVSILAGHKYYAKLLLNGAQQKFRYYNGSTVVQADVTNAIFSATNVGTRVTFGENVVEDTNVVVVVHFFDLTLMFGAGNEPTTVEEFEALFPLPYYAYNAGEIISNKTEQVKAVGFNQWDEEWESGSIDNSTGAKISSTTIIRSKNYIPVFAQTIYYLWYTANGSNADIKVFYYDANKNFISSPAFMQAGTTFTPPAECAFILFKRANTTTYNHDICINLSDASRNGQYEPYEKHTLTLGLNSFDVKDGEGNVTTVQGLKSAGSVKDEIDLVRQKYINRVGTVVLTGNNSENYNLQSINANNIANFEYLTTDRKSGSSAGAICDKLNQQTTGISETTTEGFLLSGETKIYLRLASSKASTVEALRTWLAANNIVFNLELATPVEYDLVNPIGQNILVNALGTLRRLPEDTASAVLAPISFDAKYAMDAVKILNSLPTDYTSIPSLDALLTTLGTALGGTFTRTWDSSNNKYTFTFTPSA